MASISPMDWAARTIRGIALDAVSEAGSGHPGTPMGCAEIGAYLYGVFLRYHPKEPHWINRDRFILSAGHASLLQYTCLHLAGFPISVADLKQFRQMDSITPSHPEYGKTPGVETTTGVDGQGIAHGIGQALGIKLLAARMNRPQYPIFDGKVVVLAGDGCFMEGISHEASALAGHWRLDNLIIIYDRNKTSLDGFVSESCSENTRARYEAYGWSVEEVDGHDTAAIGKIFSRLRTSQDKPALVIADTVIGKGVSSQAGSFLIHSGPVAEADTAKAKAEMGLPSERFYISPEAKNWFAKRGEALEVEMKAWKQRFENWKKAYPELALELESMKTANVSEKQIRDIILPSSISGRKASGEVLQHLVKWVPSLYGGSADLARSDMTYLHQYKPIEAADFSGRNIKYGVREFGMGGIAIGMAQTGRIIPFVGTFLAFTDYMMSAIRMAAMMKLQIIYQFTHDTFWIGQDGPTHQPIEHLAHLRAIPHLQVIRPADGREVKMAWLAALNYKGPTALILSRQNLPNCLGTDVDFASGVGKGAYVVYGAKSKPDVTLLATGSELSLALQVVPLLEMKKIKVKVVSFPSWEMFEQQSDQYRTSILGPKGTFRVSIEAGSEMGWQKYVSSGMCISLNRFGISGKAEDLAQKFGFTPGAIARKIVTSLPRAKL